MSTKQRAVVETSRITESFDSEWKFSIGEHDGADKAVYEDNSWRILSLPHDWSIEGPFDQNNPSGGDGGYLPAGEGWYRKSFTVPEYRKGKNVFIQFDGVYMNSEVWINGNHLGKRPNGYIGFHYNLTPYLNYGETPNSISVKVDNSEQPNSRWYSGSGIYRHTWLIYTDRLSIDHWGIVVTTPNITPELTRVEVKARLINDYTEPVQAILLSQVMDSAGKVAESTQTAVIIQGGEHKECIYGLSVRNPQFWSHLAPNLYTLVTKIWLNGKLVDENQTRFGIRSIRFDANRGFFLNEKHVKINGVCLHHDGGSVGAAVPIGIWTRRLQVLKDMGCNAIRMSHNPPTTELLDLCDQMGFLVMDEAFDEWTITKSKNQIRSYGYYQHFDEWFERDLISMLHRDRNHPSIIIWSIGNEILEQAQPSGHEIAKKLVDICHREDPSRPVTAACDYIEADNQKTTAEFLQELDIVGYNYVDRWRLRTETFYSEDKLNNPNWKIIGTEHSSVRGKRGHYKLDFGKKEDKTLNLPESGAWSNVPYYSEMIRPERLWRFTNNNDYVAGDFMWTGIDYLGEARWPNKNSSAGVIDMCGFPKDGYYFYQSQWTEKPMLHSFPHWNWQGNEGEIIPVLCYTNCDSVELFLNGKSYGVKSYESPMQGMSDQYAHYAKPYNHVTTSDLHLSWDVAYEPGTLKLVGVKDGQIVCEHETATTGVPAAIQLEMDKDILVANGNDICHVKVNVLDANGRIVPTANNLITFKVAGQGDLIAVDNGQSDSHEPFIATQRKAYNGLCLAIIRSTKELGTINIHAESVGLSSASITIKTT